MDLMVLQTQKWLNRTYRSRVGFGSVVEDGLTGWDTIYGLIRALQIELGITATANNFGSGTQSRFSVRWPQGIKQQVDGDKATSNVYGIIQGALWCKGYFAGSDWITAHFYAGTGRAIKELKTDAGIGGDSTVTLEIMMALLSMNQFRLLLDYGGRGPVRDIQRRINADYRSYTGLIPTDGVYGREMNTALIQVLQAIEGYTPAEATGNFGSGTRSRLVTLSSSSTGAGKWLWVATAALVCNDYLATASTVWNGSVASAVSRFQENYALPRTAVIDTTTWMSLLTSKGDPDRPCVACDTRFEITDELLANLRADGYQIVGRYLSEPNQDNKNPENYFKAIRPGELKRIIDGDMSFFPIFQEYSTKLSHFTAESGARHGREAYQYAMRLGIPATVIYFAVDVDVMDYQVDSNILPYFKAVTGSLAGDYLVGIYASRNVCQRVINSGYAVSAFVSDMSTGFSGNLGYPLPRMWNYDQFTEIHDYHGGEWDLDRVAYSSRIPAVDRLLPAQPSTPGYGSMNLFDLVEQLENRFEELRTIYADHRFGQSMVMIDSTAPIWFAVPTWHCILNYLAKEYLKGSKNWSMAAEPYRSDDGDRMEHDSTASRIISALGKWIGPNRTDWTDPYDGKVDIAHLAAVILGYINLNSIPDKWTGWAGDLASAMGPIQDVADLNPNASLAGITVALIGQGDDFKDNPPLSTLKLPSGLSNNCNYSDLCSDGDAIWLADTLEGQSNSNPNLLSQTLRLYYRNQVDVTYRFKRIAKSIGAEDLVTAKTKIRANFTAKFDKLLVNFLNDSYGFTHIRDEVIKAASDALAEFIF